jgi:hypothetical protein
VEADGFEWHRTAARLTADRRRDPAHTAAGLTPPFTHGQIKFEPVATVARRLAGSGPTGSAV